MTIRRFARKLSALLSLPQSRRTPRGVRRRLELEPLENRCVPAGISGTVTGFAYLDANDNVVRDAGELVLPGISLTLTGTTEQGSPVSVSATTNGSGAYSFLNVQPGAYRVSAVPGEAVVGPAKFGNGQDSVVFALGDGQTVTLDVGFQGIMPAFISLRQFLTSSTGSDFAFEPAGPGSGLANFRPNSAPTVKTTIDNVSVGKNSADTIIDLAGHFDDVDLSNSLIRFDTSHGAINVELFDRQAPRTVANFFNYINSNRFDTTIFHRLARDFVLQGGGFRFQESPAALVRVPEDPQVKNEFGTLNTRGTIAMAKLDENAPRGGPDSATSQFFFNLANNTNLNTQNGGFTVFGRLAGPADQDVVDILAALNVRDFRRDPQNPANDPNSAFGEMPIINYNGSASTFPGDTTASNFARINDVAVLRRDESLTYSVASNSNPSLLTANIRDNRLALDYATNATGTAQITIRATDRFGASVVTTFNVTVANRAPTANVALSPSRPRTDDIVTATVTTSDPDGDQVTLTYVWKVSGVVVKTATTTSTTDTLDLSRPGNGDTGDSIVVEVTPSDGTTNGAMTTVSVTVV